MGTNIVYTNEANKATTIEEIIEKVQTLNQEDFSLIVSTVAQLCNQPHC